MARRDRTTGLPRPRQRARAKQQSRFGYGDSQLQLSLWIVGGFVLVLIAAIFGWRIYDNEFRHPNKTILAIQDEKYSLKYYTDRLFLAAQSASGTNTNISILEQALLTDLENEAIGTILAREKGLTASEEEITAEIASQLGVPVGGAGSTFDTLYRQRLHSVKMSDGAYRRYVRAAVYLNKLRDSFAAEIGDKGELVTLRAVVAVSKEDADELVARINGGEDLGTVAQTNSADPTSRQKDGLFEPEPARLLPEAVRTAIDGKLAGTELFGPIQVQTAFWVFKIETRNAEGELSETQKSQLADLALEDALAEKRTQVTIKRDMNSKDFEWANDHVAD